VHYIEQVLNERVTVKRNNEISLEEVNAFDKICLSPGPGLPSEAGILNDIIKTYAPTKSILGVCLGHQAIGEVFGAGLVNLPTVMQGIARKTIVTQKDSLFTNIPSEFLCGRYHSWIVDVTKDCDVGVIAQDEQGYAMALRHKKYNVCGVQFHPESVLTEHGIQLIKNWIDN
jgi:anthranilate synthase component II